MKTMVVGAAGAIGQALCAALADAGEEVVACIRETPLPPALAARVTVQGGVDVRDEASVAAALAAHAAGLGVVWNLAAPLSVATAADPAAARAVTVGGMAAVLRAAAAVGRPLVVCFSDSIGSFGAGSPRRGAAARWLVEHPAHDPGSEYGLLKRECRALLREAERESGGRITTRWAIIPGVLHADPQWGAGTTEYALDAVAAARRGRPFVSPVGLDVPLPMIDRRDLVRGLRALAAVPATALHEPTAGYALAGYSFTARELLARLTALFPGFTYTVKADGPAARFAELWCDSLSPVEAARDLGFTAAYTFEDTLADILATPLPADEAPPPPCPPQQQQ